MWNDDENGNDDHHYWAGRTGGSSLHGCMRYTGASDRSVQGHVPSGQQI